ncbi:hypothetical protein ARSEF1564_009544 [Beauveria bassiana]
MSDSQDYTIGWISALALEFTAAQQFLDATHDRPKYVHKGDENHYTLGSIGAHNVVIAVLGAGENGIAAAAMAAKDMMHSFPNVRFCVMVGIGGGAPSKEHDIRLGDVVVSTPTFREKNYGGVVHYDFAATLKAKSFQSLHYMNQPPRACLAAVNALIAKHRSEGNGIDANISDVLEKKPRLRREYGRPEASTDRLYISDSIPIRNCQPDSSNAETHTTTLIQRDPRLGDEDNPAVHYGLIASADGFMEDAEIRDILAGELGVLCFEMEAAGLMNQFPCLVIRGICDYSDAHWSKRWRGYAAMSAATYAKDLITEILPYQLEREVGIGKLLDKS